MRDHCGRPLRSAMLGLVLACAPAVDAGEAVAIVSLSDPASLATRWRFQTGDDMAWAAPGFDDGAWALLDVPGDWGRQGYEGYAGIAWYRLRLQLGAQAVEDAERGLAVAIGRVHSAYELYAGGRLVGGAGRLPPDPVVRYDLDSTWPVPRSALASDGSLVLALRVWRGAGQARAWQGGPYEGAFLLGTAQQLTARTWRDRQIALVLGVIYLVIGLYHVYLYRRAPALAEYLWYGLLATAIGCYALLTSPWKHDLPLPWQLVKRLEYAVLDLLPPLCLQLIWTLVGVKPNRWLRAYRSSFLALAACAMLSPNLVVLFWTLDLWHYWMLPSLFGLAGLVIVKARAGHPEARTVLAGVLLFALTALNDALVDLRLLATPRAVPLGFAALILSMALSLANRFTRVFKELEAKTRELQLAQADLLRTEKLSAIGRMAAGLVHDLRNPVGAIHTYAGLIAARSTPDQQQMLQRIQDETTRSVDMMEDVLAFARGAVRVAPRAVDLGAWLGELQDYLRRELELSLIEVAVVGEVGGAAHFDPGRIRRVLCNLAWNARDAMPEGGRFEIAVQRPGGGLLLACSDTGPGVPAEVRDRLFGEFATFGKANGTGLGLALSRRVVLEHGGTIRHEDVAGGGARFVIELPPAPAAAASAPDQALAGVPPPAPAGVRDRMA